MPDCSRPRLLSGLTGEDVAGKKPRHRKPTIAASGPTRARASTSKPIPAILDLAPRLRITPSRAGVGTRKKAEPKPKSKPKSAILPEGLVLPVRRSDPNESFFDPRRAGQAVVRPLDLLALRIELFNLGIVSGSPPRLQKSASGVSRLVLHFPPQSIAEETFFETRPAGTQTSQAPRRIERQA